MKHSVRLLAVCLMIAALLAGCGTSTPPAESTSQQGGSSSSALPPEETETEAGDSSEEVTDYYKYNTYLDMLNSLYDTTDVLDIYFSVVEYQEEFQLVAGQDFSSRELYSALVFGNMGFNGYLDSALKLSDQEPFYEELDVIVQNLVPAARELAEVLDELEEYIDDSTWQNDDYAGAAEIHQKLVTAMVPFLDYMIQMEDCIDVMEDELNQEVMEQMLQDGEMIGYYTLQAVMQSEQVINLIYAEENYAENGLYIHNVEEITAANEVLEQIFADLVEALNDKDQRSKAGKLNYSTENGTEYQRYTDFLYRIETLRGRMADLLENASQGSESSYKADLVADGYSDLVYCYNTYLV